jgi:hypothetical protein
MKLTTIIGTVIAAVGLAACGSTGGAPTARPTLAPTVAATVAPTVAPTTAPTAIPTVAPAPKPKACPTGDGVNVYDHGKLLPACGTAGIYVTTTCAVAGSAQGGSIVFHKVLVGDSAWVGGSDGPEYQITSNPFPTGPWDVGTWEWAVWHNPSGGYLIARGTLTIREC